jgi:hypothetical protein
MWMRRASTLHNVLDTETHPNSRIAGHGHDTRRLVHKLREDGVAPRSQIALHHWAEPKQVRVEDVKSLACVAGINGQLQHARATNVVARGQAALTLSSSVRERECTSSGTEACVVSHTPAVQEPCGNQTRSPWDCSRSTAVAPQDGSRMGSRRPRAKGYTHAPHRHTRLSDYQRTTWIAASSENALNFAATTVQRNRHQHDTEGRTRSKSTTTNSRTTDSFHSRCRGAANDTHLPR